MVSTEYASDMKISHTGTFLHLHTLPQNIEQCLPSVEIKYKNKNHLENVTRLKLGLKNAFITLIKK